MNEEEFEIVQAMRKYGGGFVQSLSEAFSHADRGNFFKLKNAFPEYWEEYKEFALHDKIKKGLDNSGTDKYIGA